MNREDIIRMAREADKYAEKLFRENAPDWEYVRDERFANLVAAAEREACAKLCDIEATLTIDSLEKNAMRWCADAIRARGEK